MQRPTDERGPEANLLGVHLHRKLVHHAHLHDFDQHLYRLVWSRALLRQHLEPNEPQMQQVHQMQILLQKEGPGAEKIRADGKFQHILEKRPKPKSGREMESEGSYYGR